MVELDDDSGGGHLPESGHLDGDVVDTRADEGNGVITFCIGRTGIRHLRVAVDACHFTAYDDASGWISDRTYKRGVVRDLSTKKQRT